MLMAPLARAGSIAALAIVLAFALWPAWSGPPSASPHGGAGPDLGALRAGPNPSPMDSLAASVTADPPAADLGQSITFTCTASGGTSPYVFAWTLGDGNLGAGPTVSHTYTSTGTFTATCTVTDLLLGVATDSKNVVISPNPSVTASVNHNLAAPGTTLTFDAASSGGDGSYSYAWDFGDSSSGSGAPTAHAYSQTGSYQATVTLTDGNGGTASDSTSVTISDIAATANVSPSTGDTTTTFTFSAAASGGSGSPYTYAWTFGDGTTGTGSSVAHSYSSGGSYSPFVTASDSLGGSKVAQTQGVTVTSPPAPLAASASSPRAAADVGQSITFTCTGSGGTAPYTYDWSFGDGTTGSGAQITHMYTQTGAFQTTVVVTDGNGATTSGSASVTISNIQVTGSATPPSGTTETAFGFTATATGGGGNPYGYGWDFGDGTSGAGSAISHMYSTEGNYTPSVRATDALGASRSRSLPLISVSSASSPPVVPLSATLSMSTTLPRVNESITLSGAGQGGSGGYRCSWDFADGNFGTGCSVSYAWNRTGAYNVTLTFTDSAGNNATAMQTLEIVIALTASFEVGPSPAILGESAQLIAHPSGGIGPYNCTWDFGDASRASGCTASHAWKTRGRFVVWLFVNDSAGQYDAVSQPLAVESSGLFGLPLGLDLVVLAIPLVVAAVGIYLWNVWRNRDPIPQGLDSVEASVLSTLVGNVKRLSRWRPGRGARDRGPSLPGEESGPKADEGTSGDDHQGPVQ